MKVCIGLSGGVDSAAAAWLLLQEGYDVSSVTMRHIDSNGQDIESSERIADFLGIPHYVLDIRNEFRKEIINPFAEAYRKGITPNPCIFCNQKIKFGFLLDWCNQMGYGKIATGHYVRINHEQENLLLQSGLDINKDQSYFLSLLTAEQRKNIIFPLGNLTKEHVRKIVSENKLPIRNNKESQEICFIKTNYNDFLKDEYQFIDQNGGIVNKNGKVIGCHKGYWNYTIGQRRGLGISSQNPLYVIKLNAAKNIITAGEKKELYSKEIMFRNGISHIPYIDLNNKQLKLKIRYRSPSIPGRIIFNDENKSIGKVILEKEAYAVSPGQIIAAYIQEDLVFGGIID